ncbi:hypothetical protein SCHPADRAFT_948344 [Schizopora paradoxa]|uniref:Uncharacterized protein n=1 Tax=Schizopora paradoxa TaxID=27342 RepID=A0A0H2RFS2_9AGAM|nr:hypothetical protein SCHPADRAFT_948344 [Schizopora paradoxa]
MTSINMPELAGTWIDVIISAEPSYALPGLLCSWENKEKYVLGVFDAWELDYVIKVIKNT